MIRIGIIGEIGSGKTYVAKSFGYPVFNADAEVNKIYSNNRKCFEKLNRKFPKYVKKFPIKKNQIKQILNKKNIKIISKIVHPYVRLSLKKFLRKNKNNKYVVLDIPNGEKFTKENVRSIRPGFGIEPKLLPTVLGQYATRDLKRGEPLDWDMIKRDQ